VTTPKKPLITQTKGISQTEITNTASIPELKAKRKQQPDAHNLVASILNKDITALSRAITLIESNNQKHYALANTIVKQCLSHANKSVRIGITGIPGVGKSTFIEAFGCHLISKNKRVAVLTIDPTSTLNKGSILGDKTRMAELAKQKNAFIRPSPSGNTLGGVAQKTKESIILCEAAGFDVIIIETVGVGQNETAVHNMVDFFLLLKLAGTGDDLQSIKRGVIELADAIAINKADGEHNKQATLYKNSLAKALSLYPEKLSGWKPKVTTCSALNNEGIESIWNMVEDYKNVTTANNYFHLKRQEQNKFWLIDTIETRLKANFFSNQHIKKELEKQLKLIEANKTTPFAAANYLLSLKY